MRPIMPGDILHSMGITTTSAPVSAAARPSLPDGGHEIGDGRVPVVLDLVGMCETSAATPGVPITS